MTLTRRFAYAAAGIVAALAVFTLVGVLGDDSTAATPQKTCPIMGGTINKNQYVDAAGHRIYVCCAGCLAKVEAEPQAALATIRSRGETPEPLPVAELKAPAEAAHVSTEAVAVLLRAKVPLALLDARGPQATHLPGATPVAGHPSAAEAARLIPTKESLVVTYCGSAECPASRKLAVHLRELGYVNLLEYTDGIRGWTVAGQPVVKSE